MRSRRRPVPAFESPRCTAKLTPALKCVFLFDRYVWRYGQAGTIKLAQGVSKMLDGRVFDLTCAQGTYCLVTFLVHTDLGAITEDFLIFLIQSKGAIEKV